MSQAEHPTRSTADWLLRAARATTQQEADAAVLGCAASARDEEWRMVLRKVGRVRLASPAAVQKVTDRALGVLAGSVPYRVAVVSAVAGLRADRLEDAAGARAALEVAEAILRAASPHVRVWLSLADVSQRLAGADAGRRCFEAAQELALHAGVDPICAVVQAWAKHDYARALALLHEAERREDHAAWRSVAEGWAALGDAAAVRRVLGAALARAEAVADVLAVAAFWSALDAPADALRVLRHAHGVACSCDDWLQIAKRAYDTQQPTADVYDAVEHAELAQDGSDVECERVARAYLFWARDEHASNRVGPRGVVADALRLPARELEGWSASAADLIDLLCDLVEEADLQEMAQRDIAFAEEHLDALRDLRETRLIPHRLTYAPYMCLVESRTAGESLHRALASVLLILAHEPARELARNAAILTESCLALGAEAARDAAAFFAFLATTAPRDRADPAEPTVALLALLVLAANQDPEGLLLDELSRTLDAEHDLAAAADRMAAADPVAWMRLLAPWRYAFAPVERALRLGAGESRK